MTTNSNTGFVISPFGEPFDTYFAHILKPSLEDCGLYAVRGDSLYRPTTIVDDIWQGIRSSKLLIAELTDRNPNVFYELGLAHALSKPVILISRSIEDVPFDLRGIRVLLYDKDHPEWGGKLRNALTKSIQEVLQDPATAIPSTFKVPVAVKRPEEPASALRIKALETAVARLTEMMSVAFDDPFAAAANSSSPAPKLPQAKLKPGDAVFHSKFGKGEVLSVEGKGPQERAQINFARHGVKWLALAIAQLTKLNDP